MHRRPPSNPPTLQPSPPLLLAVLVALTFSACTPAQPKLLVFSRTEGFRHQSIEAGTHAVLNIARDLGLDAVHTEDPAYFSEDSLRNFAAVVFLNTTGDVLDYRQQADFERFIQAGGGYLGVHAASDTEYDWPWYGELVGAWFVSHPRNQEAVVQVTDRSHPATRHLPKTWTRVDEWYNFRNPPANVNILASLDESSYEGGSMEGNHPIMWYREFGAEASSDVSRDFGSGRAFYTAMGHTEESYSDSLFLGTLKGAIEFVVGTGRLDYDQATTDRVPEENRFTREILTAGLNEPMSLAVLDENRILFTERHGTLRLYDRESASLKTAAEIPVYSEKEDGLLGVAVDPNFDDNNWIYLFYSPPMHVPDPVHAVHVPDPVRGPVQFVSRFEMVGDSLDLESEVVVLEIPVQRDECCHSAGSLEFGPDGNLFISVGDNTNPFASNGYAPIDERPGRAAWDAQRSSGNTNDLRGSILRIKPNDDGSYAIPEGNLFPPGTEGTRTEIYAMGLRNPYRISIDDRTGFLYWGDVGPDAGTDDSLRGPRGYDLINQARNPGFWGWPLMRGNRYPYRDYNFATGEHGAPFDPDAPINDSPNNTGRRELPPVAEPFVWYPYDESAEFPWTGTGGRTAMAGPIYYADNYSGPEKFPHYFDGKLIAYEWMRDWMFVITMDDDGDFVKAEPFMPGAQLDNPGDMAFGPDGSLYILEYGESWNTPNADARLNRITYTAGNRYPVAALEVEPLAGAHPLEVRADATRSSDPDGDKLSYVWTLDGNPLAENSPQVGVTLNNPGEHELMVTVVDEHGSTSVRRESITAGNEPPVVNIRLTGNQQFFWPGRELKWLVEVEDKEDGSINGQIAPADVHTMLLFEPAGTAPAPTPTASPDEEERYGGQTLIARSDCAACHAVDRRINGPAWRDIAARYTEADAPYLTRKIITGGSGVWGETAMSAHPQLDPQEVDLMVEYILSTNRITPPTPVPTTGTEVVGEGDVGRVILTATYTDRGANDVDGIEARDRLVLHPLVLEAEALPLRSEGTTANGPGGFVGGFATGTHVGMRDVDLTDIRAVDVVLVLHQGRGYDGTIEIRLDTPDGELIGSARTRRAVNRSGMDQRHHVSIPLESTPSPTHNVYVVFKATSGDVAVVDQLVLSTVSR